MGKIMQSRPVEMGEVVEYHANPRRGDVGVIKESLEAHGQYRPIVVNVGTHAEHQMEILAGNHTFRAAKELGWEQIDAVLVDVDDEEAARIVLVDNRSSDLAENDDTLLANLLQSLPDLDGTGYDLADLEHLIDVPDPAEPLNLAERFGAPPLSVLSSRGGAWQARKKAWLSLGLRSELGRADDLVMDSPQRKYTDWYRVKNQAEAEAGHSLSDDEILRTHLSELHGSGGTSIFDPVLCELLVSWFSGRGQRVLDPWAGGSVRGVVSGALGRDYLGIDLRPEQINADKEQADLIEKAANAGFGPGGGTAEWACGDSTSVLRDYAAESFDMALGCPPYYGLEQYSDDPADLSTMSPQQFDEAMAVTLTEVSRTLRPDSFAVFVVGSVRDKKGHILDMRRCMEAGAERAGMYLCNDAILLTPVGSAAQIAARMFERTRTLARVHQEVLVFVKGDRKAAAERIGDVDTGTLGEVVVDDDAE